MPTLSGYLIKLLFHISILKLTGAGAGVTTNIVGDNSKLDKDLKM